MATSRMQGALAGALSGAVGLLASEAAAALMASASPVSALADRFIEHTPGWLKSFAVAAFGTLDKTVLVAIAVAIALAGSVLIGAIGIRRRLLGGVLALAWTVPALLALLGGDGPALAWVPWIALVVVGTGSLYTLWSSADRAAGTGAAGTEAAGTGATGTAADEGLPENPDRRAFLQTALLVTAVGAGAAIAWRQLAGRAVDTARRALTLPPAASTAPAAPAAADLAVAGTEPFLTPTRDFYRIDTAVRPPQVDAASWRLRVHGLVERPLTLSLDDLLSRRLVERRITLMCVSNPVGGDLIGNATWLGVPLHDILAEAGVQRGADALASTSADGWTAGTPLDVVTDGRDALIAVAMNGDPLTVRHGFPARLVVPGLYGYVSATKWLTDLEITRFDDFAAYWTIRGWSERGPVKTSSRIDVPRAGTSVDAGTVTVAGVAWAQHTGIDAVEVSVDGADWLPATLAAEDTVDTWRQWRLDWPATPGRHELRVRAQDRTGAWQDPTVRDVVPDGATGLHTITVTVS